MVKLNVTLDEMPKSCQECPFKHTIDDYDPLYCDDCMFARADTRIREEYKTEDLYLPKDRRLKSCPLEEEDEEEFEPFLTPAERADVLNTINQALEQKGIDLEVGGYSDMYGVLFDVYLMRR